MLDYVITVGAVFAINLLPAFGPPTWAILVFLYFNLELEPALLVPAGALAAASGRLVLASATRQLRPRLRPERLANLSTLDEALTRSRARVGGGLLLFALSPVPSAQLFVGAGLLSVPIAPLTLAFFCGRLASYAIYVGAATAASEPLSKILGDSLTSPLAVSLQLLMLGGLVAIVRLDWKRLLGAGGLLAADRIKHV